jgi:Fic family protein
VDLEALRGSSIGQLVTISGQDARFGEYSYYAYLPDPLPADVALNSGTWTAVTEAATALGKLDQACRALPDPRLLIRPALWREALDTSALEGTHGALPELLEAQLSTTQFTSPEVVEIRAYERTALNAFDLIKDRPLTASLVSHLQGRLFRDVRDKPLGTGELRKDQVWIGPKGRPIHEARFVPPPPGDQLRAGLEAWAEWVQAEHAHLPPVLQTALAHYQFETLHPFSDGNGRIGRLAIALQLIRTGSIQEPAVTVSPWFLRRRSEYQSHLLQVSCTGDWNPWVTFFCQAVREQCDSLVAGAVKLTEWLANARRTIHDRRWTGAIHKLLEDLVEWPVVTIAFTAERYHVSQMNATRMVNHLVEIGVLTELTGKNYGRVFGAKYVMDTVEGI